MLCALFQAVYLVVARIAVGAQLRDLRNPKSNNALGRVLLAFRGDSKRTENAELAELRISEAVLREVPKLERFQAFLRLAVAAGPLLGLIGTVIGMIITFRAIVASGTSDPKIMARGIGQAMIATVLGLGIAIPLLFLASGLAALSRAVTQILDEQSQSLLAESVGERKQKRQREHGTRRFVAADVVMPARSTSGSRVLAPRGTPDDQKPSFRTTAASEWPRIPSKVSIARSGSISSSPTDAEEAALESHFGIDIPTREEMEAIEISSRLYHENEPRS